MDARSAEGYRKTDYAPLKGELGLASQVFEMLSFQSAKESSNFYCAMLSGGSDKERKLRTMGKERLLPLLNKLRVHQREDSYYQGIENTLEAAIGKNAQKTNSWIKKIFGRLLPRTVTIIPYEVYSSSTSGVLLAWKPTVIMALGGSFTENQVLGVFLHEVLHALVRPFLREQDDSGFEESLLSYFVPHGVLAEKTGLVKRFDFDKYESAIAQSTFPASEGARSFLEVMKSYYAICGEKTIWQHLKEHGFGKYLK